MVTATYSAQGWLTQLSTTSGGTTTTLASNISYTGTAGAAMHITGMSLGNGVYSYGASYDLDQRLTSSSLTRSSDSTLLYQTQPGYDGVGNVTSVTMTNCCGILFSMAMEVSMDLLFEAKKGTLSYYGQVVYRKEEWSLDFLPRQVSDFDVIIVDMLNIAFLVMDTSIAYACQICGYHPRTIWSKKKLFLPTSFEGSLILHSDVVNEFDNVKLEGAERWKTSHDETLGWLCIGNDRKDQEDQAVEFATGIIAVVNRPRLKSIWLKSVFVVHMARENASMTLFNALHQASHMV